MPRTKSAHLVGIPVGAWGHLRPLLHLYLNLLCVHPQLRITVLIQPSSQKNIEKELSSVALQHLRQPPSAVPASGGTVLGRLQLIVVTSDAASVPIDFSPEEMVNEAVDFAKVLPDFLKGVFAGEAKIGPERVAHNKFAEAPVSFIMYDLMQIFVPDVVESVRATLELGIVPMVAFAPCNAAATWHLFAPGGHVDLMETKVKAAIEAGTSVLDAYEKYGFASYGDVARVPGLPPKYDYEYKPLMGTMSIPSPVYQQMGGMHRAAWHPSTTALIIPTVQELEQEAHAVLEHAMGRPVHMAGIQFPEPMWQGIKMPKVYANEDDKRVMEFLDDMQAKHGDKSVIYVSFGSFWYPALRPELVIYLLDSLIESRQPFIFAYATFLLPEQPDAVKERFAAYPDGCLIKFAPQWQVLEHPATGFAVTHCGSNTSAECMMSELPIVAMPFAADQGEFASMLCEVYKVGITLKQTYTFKEGNDRFHTLYDGTEIIGTEEAIKEEMKAAWKLMRGPEGEAMRQRMAGLREKAKQSWQNGCSRRTMEAMEQYF